jgi:hypothetical protein
MGCASQFIKSLYFFLVCVLDLETKRINSHIILASNKMFKFTLVIKTKMKKRSLIFIFLLFTYFTFSFFWNPFPKRLLGEYSGTQESYKINIDEQIVNVPKTFVSIDLVDYENILIRQGEETIKATYTVKNKTKTYYNLGVTLENKEKENWQLYRKGKKLIRPAIHPRPSIILLK